MAVLGIESSAHTFGVGIVENGKILANEKQMFKIGTTGMIPGEVANFHIENAANVIEDAIKKSKIKTQKISAIGYTKGPGLGPCLQVGLLSAKTLASKFNVPIIPVNHGVAHVEIAKHALKMNDPLALYVSGGNSQILKLDKKTRRYRVLGETFDVGIGNMLDNFARVLKLKPAWGSSIEHESKNGKYISLPYTVKGMDFSFTGLLTGASKLVGKESNADLCFSLQETAFSMLCEATERALLLSKSKELCICGGVAQNNRLSQMLQMVADEHGARFGRAQNEFNADNGAMIALLAEKMFNSGFSEPLSKCDIQQRYRIDEMKLYG